MQNIELAKTVTALLDESSISETEICRRAKLPRATIYRLKEGLVDPRLSTLKALADFFTISIDQLIGERKIPSSNHKGILKTFHIPVMPWDIATLMRVEKNNFTENNFIVFQTDGTDDEDHYIALQTCSDAMSPNLPPNTTIIVDKERVPKNQDYVIAAIDNNKNAVLRRLLLEGETKLLQASNAAFPIISLPSERNILGVVVQARHNF